MNSCIAFLIVVAASGSSLSGNIMESAAWDPKYASGTLVITRDDLGMTQVWSPSLVRPFILETRGSIQSATEGKNHPWLGELFEREPGILENTRLDFYLGNFIAIAEQNASFGFHSFNRTFIPISRYYFGISIGKYDGPSSSAKTYTILVITDVRTMRAVGFLEAGLEDENYSSGVSRPLVLSNGLPIASDTPERRSATLQSRAFANNGRSPTGTTGIGKGEFMGKRGFSWKRASGLSNLKRKVSKATGVPLTKSGRKQKVNRMVGKAVTGGTDKRKRSASGCMVALVWFAAVFISAALLLLGAFRL